MSMRLVNREKLLAPGKCLVCERVPPARVVDTGFKNFNNVASDPMRGRKYVCDRCGEKIATALAYPSPAQVADWKEEIIDLQNQLEHAKADGDAVAAFHEMKAWLEEQKRDVALDD